ncbi:hypothetical protein GGH96_004730 [Coemansia sp. RSA 1972]|nr:hypothetical protein GGH96_004730 [Coemansia sp. RSA 1972]
MDNTEKESFYSANPFEDPDNALTPNKRRSADASDNVASKKAGGRTRPAPLLLMYELVHSPESEQLLDPLELVQAEHRSLELLLTDPETRDYQTPELHDCRVRCVFDSMESRGIVYRAKRMQAKLAHYLQIDRARYIRVYQARMNALIASGTFNAVDLQVIRGHLTMLESAGDSVGPISDVSLREIEDRVLANRQSVVDNGVLRKRATAADIQRSLVCLAARFALPVDFTSSPEFQNVCSALFTAQKDSVLVRPFALASSSGYTQSVDHELRIAQEKICQQLLDAAHYSVVLDGWQITQSSVLISVAVVVDATYTFDWVVVGHSAESAAEQVAGVLQNLKIVFMETARDSQKAPQMPPLLAIISSGRVPIVSVVRQLVARSVGCCYHMDCAAQTVDSLASCLLEPASRADPYSRVTLCSASLVAVARAVASDAEAHQKWIERKGCRIAPSSADCAHTLLPLFQQMVSVDYEFLLELKDIVLQRTGSMETAAHFDDMLDRSNAPMFLALVQALTLLDHCTKLVSSPRFTLPDLAVVLARLESTLESLSSGTDDMQLAAHCVLAKLRRSTLANEESALMCMVLAHSLSLYPTDNVRDLYAEPLSSIRVLEFANALWPQISRTQNSGFTMPELYTKWAEYCDAMVGVRRTHASNLPSTFGMRRIIGLAGVGSGAADLEPMLSLSAALCDGPVCAPSLLTEFLHEYNTDGSIETRLSDPFHRTELLVAAMVRDKQNAQQSKATRTANPASIAQKHHDMASFCVDLNEPTDQGVGPVATGPAVYDEDTAIIATWHDDDTHAQMASAANDDDTHAQMASAANNMDTAIYDELDQPAQDSLADAGHAADSMPSPTLLWCYFDSQNLPSLLLR